MLGKRARLRARNPVLPQLLAKGDVRRLIVVPADNGEDVFTSGDAGSNCPNTIRNRARRQCFDESRSHLSRSPCAIPRHRAGDLHRPRHAEPVTGIFQANVGKAGNYYYWISRGVDNREVWADRVRKSIGAEKHLLTDLTEFEAMVSELQPLIDKATRSGGNARTRARGAGA